MFRLITEVVRLPFRLVGAVLDRCENEALTQYSKDYGGEPRPARLTVYETRGSAHVSEDGGSKAGEGDGSA